MFTISEFSRANEPHIQYALPPNSCKSQLCTLPLSTPYENQLYPPGERASYIEATGDP